MFTKLSPATRIGLLLAIISVLFFWLCTLWGFVLVSAPLKTLHFQLLQLAYPGFSFTLQGYLIGSLEAFVYGLVTGVSVHWLHRQICCDHPQAKGKST